MPFHFNFVIGEISFAEEPKSTKRSSEPYAAKIGGGHG